MKTHLNIEFLVVFILLIITSSCRQVHIYESKAIIISRVIDITLQDSALIYGMVLYAGDEKTPLPNTNIWIESSNFKTKSDNAGSFSMKIPPGIYTIKCLHEYSSEEFVATIKNIAVLPNEKIEIKFLHGNKSE